MSEETLVDKKRTVFGTSESLKDIKAYGRITYREPLKCLELLLQNSLSYITNFPGAEKDKEEYELNKQKMCESFYGIIVHVLKYMDEKGIKYSVDPLPCSLLFYENNGELETQGYAHTSRRTTLKELETVLNFLDRDTGIIFYMVIPGVSDFSKSFDAMNDNFVIRCHVTSNAPIEYSDFDIVEKTSVENKLDVLIDYIVALKKKKYIAKV
jgi:hypothetical protein